MIPEPAALKYCRRSHAAGLIVPCALGLWLGFPNDLISFPPLVLLWPLCLCFLGSISVDYKKAFAAGWLATFLGTAPTLYWLCYPTRDVGDLPWPLAIACALLIAACLSLQGAFYCALARRAATLPKINRVFFLGLAWYLLEYCCELVAGFPWLALGGALAVWPFWIQAAAVFGAGLTSALWLMLALFAVAGFDGEIKWRKTARALCSCLLLFLVSAGFYGLHRDAGGESVDVLYVDGDIDQNQKWDPAFQKQSLDVYLNLTREGAAEARKKGIARPLIIWPETALPFFFQRSSAYALEVSKLARELDCPILFGAPAIETKKGLPDQAVYNRAILMTPDGKIEDWYDKVHLVPFGEYVPSWLKLDFLEALLQGVGVYENGESSRPLVYGSLALGMLICYEGIFPGLARERVAAGANILADISNDGWFRNSPAARQHLFLTVPRCVEQNRWLLRGTNTGISATINNRGQITTMGPRFRAGWILSRGAPLEARSIFYYLQPWLPFAVAVLIFLSAIGRRLKNKVRQ